MLEVVTAGVGRCCDRRAGRQTGGSGEELLCLSVCLSVSSAPECFMFFSASVPALLTFPFDKLPIVAAGLSEE